MHSGSILGRVTKQSLSPEADPAADGGQASVPSHRRASPRWQPGAIVADRFRLARLLGTGAMGDVWCALDLELDETVALKRLREQPSAGGRLADFFRREVRLARRVSHRNVARVFELVVIKGPEGSQLSLTMEFVQGHTLDQLLKRRHPFSPATVVRILREACAGLGAVHEAGVLHRDIKPANVMLGEGDRVVLMDFGVALAAGDATSERGTLAGTPAYMAPEFFTGSQATVASDIYALGCIGFELLAGRRAFEDTNLMAILAAKAKRVQVPPADEVPGLAAVVETCLEPTPEVRFQSAADLDAALASLGSPLVPAFRQTPSVLPPAPAPLTIERERPQLAVLSFEPQGIGPDLVDLLVDDFIGELAQHKWLRVLATGPVKRLQSERGQGPSAWVDIGKELGANVVVGGDARADDSGLEVALRALSVPEGRTLWRWQGKVATDEHLPSMAAAAQSFLRSEPMAAFEGAAPSNALESSPSRPSASSGSGSHPLPLPVNEPRPPSPSISEDTLVTGPSIEEDAIEPSTRVRRIEPAGGESRVLELYLRGRALYLSASARDIEEAIGCFEEAQAAAPEDPRIASALTVALGRYLFMAPAAMGALIDRAERVAEHALRVAPSMGEPHHARAVLMLHRGQPVEAVRSLRRALRCAPSLVAAHGLLGQLLLEAGHGAEGRQRLVAAERLEPGNVEMVWPRYRFAVLTGRKTEADAALEAMMKVTGGLRSHWALHLRLAAWRRDSAALAGIERAARHALAPSEPLPAFGAFAAVAVHGASPASSYATLRRLGDEGGSMRTRCFHYQVLAELAGFVGDAAEAARALDLARGAALFDRSWLARCPLLDCARGTPEYAEVLAQASAFAETMRHAYYSETDLGSSG
jgi:TolB-like protein